MQIFFSNHVIFAGLLVKQVDSKDLAPNKSRAHHLSIHCTPSLLGDRDRGFPMDSFVSAILGEFASKSLSFLIKRYSKNPLLPPAKEDNIERLERILLRVAVVVEEAEGRRITNHAMLRQLNMLREDMHRGGYVLDTFRRRRAHGPEEMVDEDEVSCSSLSLSKFNPAKRVRFCTISSRRHGKKKGELEQVLDNLDIAIADMVEFVLLLKSYPPMHRQPYNSYMFMEKCMFGRQMEMEQVINFLLHVDPIPDRVDNHLGVLPIIGPAKIGKSTLVEHVCYDERVRSHFSHIVFLSDNDMFREETSLFSPRDRGVVRHEHISASSNGGRSLVIIEIARDVDEDELRRLQYSASRSHISPGSKIIITSRSERIAKLGTTTQPLRLKFLPREAYWYFFKVLAFGSSDPEDHAEVASASMAMVDWYFDQEKHKGFTGPFIDLSILACLVRASTVHESDQRSLCERLNAKMRSSHLVLRSSRGDSAAGTTTKSKCVLAPGVGGTTMQYCEIYDDHHRIGGLAREEEEEEAPKINLQDVLSGGVAPRGKFDLVLWKSHLPPYYTYIYSCEIREFKSIVATTNEIRQKRKVSS